MKKGKLYGIGVGPGDSKLLTVKAVEAIEQADMIITPKTEKKEGSVAFNIAKPYIPDTVEIFPMVFQMNTDMEAVNKQWEINRKLIQEKLDEGKNLVFLTLGDPMLYSTYMYIFNEFKDSEEYEVETIPGIPAFLGIASYIGLPVTEWEENVLIIPATCDHKRKLASLIADHTEVWLMNVPHTKDNESSRSAWNDEMFALTRNLEKLVKRKYGKTIKINGNKIQQSVENEQQHKK